MKPFFKLFIAVIGWISATDLQAQDAPVLTLPIRFHIPRDAKMTVKGQAMDMWIKPEDLQGVVIDEVNRIWKQANIRFVVESCLEEKLLSPPERDQLLRNVENAKRGDKESADNGRTKSIAKLLDRTTFHPAAHNIYLLPFIGSTLQGYADLGGNQIVVALWTDKAFKGEKPPVKTLLVEPEPMNVGSLARTIAHELGHNLGLNHPPKTAPATIPRIMGGAKQGYGLVPEEIATARKHAQRELDTAGHK